MNSEDTATTTNGFILQISYHTSTPKATRGQELIKSMDCQLNEDK